MQRSLSTEQQRERIQWRYYNVKIEEGKMLVQQKIVKIAVDFMRKELDALLLSVRLLLQSEQKEPKESD